MEKQLIEDWDEVDQTGDCAFQFSPAILKIDIGQFKKGTKFEMVHINFETGKAKFMNWDVEADVSTGFEVDLNMGIYPSTINTF